MNGQQMQLVVKKMDLIRDGILTVLNCQAQIIAGMEDGAITRQYADLETAIKELVLPMAEPVVDSSKMAISYEPDVAGPDDANNSANKAQTDEADEKDPDAGTVDDAVNDNRLDTVNKEDGPTQTGQEKAVEEHYKKHPQDDSNDEDQFNTD